MKKELMVITLGFVLILICFGISYAFFNYTAVTDTSYIKTGSVYMKLNNKASSDILLTNVFPETMEHARARTDNYLEFEIIGYRSIQTKDITYTISLVYGDEDSSKNRIDDSYLVFDLVKVTDDGEEYIVDSTSYASIDNTLIHTDTINSVNEQTDVYRLRCWVRDDLLISSTSSLANYTSEEWKNLYSSVKIKVVGNM